MLGSDYNFTYREKDKGWQVILSYKDISGKWKTRSKQGFPTKKAARIGGEALLEAVRSTLETVPISPDLVGITLKEFSELVFHSRNLTYNTMSAYRHALINYGPQLLEMPVRDISYLDIQRAMKDWKYAPATRTLNIRCLKMLFSQAIEPYQLRTDNPAQAIQMPKKGKKKRVKALTKDELKILLDGMQAINVTDYTICAVAAFAGLRWGEIIGLTWADIDYKGQNLHVTKQYTRIAPKKRGYKAIKNESNGYRIIPVPQKLLRILSEYKALLPISLDGRIFYLSSPSTGSINYRIKKFLPNASIHDLRHTYATTLLANGQDIKTVAALIGDDVKTVISIYIDYTDDMRQKALADLEKIFAKAKCRKCRYQQEKLWPFHNYLVKMIR